MAISLEIEKKLKGFTLKTAFESKTSSVGILGASGSGKSMTLRCIAGIEKPDRGRIVINGKTVFDSEKNIDLKPQERRVGYLFQNYALFPTMTVRDNILCGFRGEKKDREEKLQDFVKRYQLEGLEKRYPSQLSGGQQQRVAIARALASKPAILLADEPTGNLDSKTSQEVLGLLKLTNSRFSQTIVMITHSEELAQLCDRIIRIEDGRIVENRG